MAVPAVPPPERSVVRTVAQVALIDYSLDSWSVAAKAAALSLSVEGEGAVLSAMVHPPAAPVGIPIWDWVFRIQVAAALICVQRPNPMSLMLNLVNGPVDWTTTAGIVGLLDLARREPGQRSTIFHLLVELANRPMSPIWFSCAALPAMTACRDIPELQPDLLGMVESWLDQD